MATHDNNSFGREKIVPGAAYILSEAYRNRFGDNSGRWLVVTSGGKTRQNNLIKQTKEKARKNASMFFVTTLDQIRKRNILSDLIWWQADLNQPVALLDLN